MFACCVDVEEISWNTWLVAHDWTTHSAGCHETCSRRHCCCW